MSTNDAAMDHEYMAINKAKPADAEAENEKIEATNAEVRSNAAMDHEDMAINKAKRAEVTQADNE